MKIRVASYNVLSSSLCSPGYFTGVSNPKFCSSKYRFEGLLQKLTVEISLHTIICLQEVSLSWTANLHTFFEKHDYCFIVSNYGNRFNGYMGVGVAYPRSRFTLRSTDISCISETKTGGWFVPKVEGIPPSMFSLLFQFTTRLVSKLLNLVNLQFLVLKNNEQASFWDNVRQRNNTMVTLRLESKTERDTTPEFLVATYHMPCQFRDAVAMNVYTLLCFQRLQALSEGGNILHILGGDFNFTPKSTQYNIVVKNELAPEFQPAKLFPTDSFECELKQGPLKSAYLEVLGKEPAFTNFAFTKNDKEAFKDTLDYIFYSPVANKTKMRIPRLMCEKVLELAPTLGEDVQSFPSETEFSDHVLIAAEFDVGYV